jgi:hypothetical protein
MGARSDDPRTVRVPSTAYEMVPSSQDIFFERIVIQRLKRRRAAKLSAFVQKNKTGFIAKCIIVKYPCFEVRQLLSVL